MPLEFIECTHTYLLDGVEVPSVTQILANCGISDVSGIPADKLAFAAARGTAVHRFCQFLDEDDADWGGIEGTILEPYCRAYSQFLSDFSPAHEHVELPFFYTESCASFAGTIDRVSVVSGKRMILDIKTGSIRQKSWQIQTAAYCLGSSWSDSGSRPGRGAVHLKQDGSYRLIEHDDYDDFRVWKEALDLWHWKNSPMKRAKANRGRKSAAMSGR